MVINMRLNLSAKLLLPLLLGAVVSLPVWAFEDLSDEYLSSVSGQAGVTFTYKGNTNATSLSIPNLRWNVDCGGIDGCAGGYATYPQSSYFSLNNFKIASIGAGGAAPSSPFQVSAILDVGADPAKIPGVSLQGSWNRMRVSADSLTVKAPGAANTSFGMYAFDSQGSFSILNSNWLFDSTCGTSCTAKVSLQTTAPAQLYYRQSNAANSPELVYDNMNFSLSATGTQLSVKNNGLYFSQANASLNWNFDLRFRSSPALAYRTDQGDLTNFFYFGLESGLVNPIFQVRPGGAWLGGSPQYDQSVRNSGINISLITDLDSSFAVVLGEGGASPTLVRFENWQILKPGNRMLSIPNVTLDVVHGGGAGVPNIPTDFCLGATNAATAGYCNANYHDRDPTPATGAGSISRFVASPATGSEGDALLIMARDIQLNAYPKRVTVVDPVAGTSSYNWGLLTTTGDMDATFVLYPGTSGGAGTTGFKIDAVLSTATPQVSPGDWDESLGTHFMIADTDANVGIGFLDMNYLIKADNLYVTLGTNGVTYSCNGSAGATTCLYVYADGQFGGGDLANLSDKDKVARGFDLIIRQNFSNFSLTMTPDVNKLRYSMAMTLDDANKPYNYVMLTEPDYNTAAFKFGQMSGSAQITNGVIDLMPSNTTSDGIPHLSFSQDFVVTNDFKIDDISFNGQSLGRIVMPTGSTLHTTLALKPQVP